MELIKAIQTNFIHCLEIYFIYCENIKYSFSEIKPTLLNHFSWYLEVFASEIIYLLKQKEKIIGYLRINKSTNEISIGIKSEFQNKGFGCLAVKILGRKDLIARVRKDNPRAIHFFRKLNIKTYLI